MKYYEFWVNHDRKKEEFFKNDQAAIVYGKRYVFSNNIVTIYCHESNRIIIAEWKNGRRIK